MTRVRFDPSFVEHERWERLGADALVLHVAACSYAVRTLSDGLVTRARLRVLTPLVENPEATAAALIADGLWREVDDGAQLVVCQVRDDLRHADGRGDEQPSRAFVEKERARARGRQEDFRRRRRAASNAGSNAVTDDVDNAPQASADQPGAVQEPEGSSSCTAPRAADELVRQVLKHRPHWSESDVRSGRTRLVALFTDAVTDTEAQADADMLLRKLATRTRDRVPDLGAFLADRTDDDMRALPETPARQAPAALKAARNARRLDDLPNGADARAYARTTLPPDATAARIDLEALQLLSDEPDFAWQKLAPAS